MCTDRAAEGLRFGFNPNPLNLRKLCLALVGIWHLVAVVGVLVDALAHNIPDARHVETRLALRWQAVGTVRRSGLADTLAAHIAAQLLGVVAAKDLVLCAL